ncbi:MAG: CRISPR-associated endonuclease Cas1 [Ilumatobacteraceae bacterium]
MSATDVPDLVPARMVNEFAYCPRLFFLEWVDGQFAHNADTAEGAWQHRAVDVERGRMPLPEDDDVLREARSITLSSERLGLIAKMDIVEGRGRFVVPIDVKKGRPPSHGPAYEPELVQLCVQGLVLAENGYPCEEGILYFAETRQRVEVPFTESLIARTLQLVERLRRAAVLTSPPPPLVDSPKCPRCSLVGICMPDEINALTVRSTRSPRRLTPSAQHARPMYVTEQGASVGIRDGRFRITRRRDDVIGEARFIDVSQINLYGNVQVTAPAMRECFAREIPVLWFSYGGWFSGIADGLPGKNVELRRRQSLLLDVEALSVARRMIAGKIRNSRTMLMRNARDERSSAVAELRELQRRAETAESAASLLGFEGAAARAYFRRFGSMLRANELGTFDFDGRNRRPPRDPVNCLLSFVYGLLTKDLTTTCLGIGFDPYVGVYHRPRFGRPALALDLAEEFRPLVAESTVLNLINNREVGPTDFVVRAGGVALTQLGRRTVIDAYERRLDTEVTHPVFKYRITYRRTLEVQARVLAAVLVGETAEYAAFVTR